MIVLTAKTTTDKLLWGFLSLIFVAPIALLAMLTSPVVLFCCGLKELARNLFHIFKLPLFPLACVLAALVPGSEINLRIGNQGEVDTDNEGNLYE